MAVQKLEAAGWAVFVILAGVAIMNPGGVISGAMVWAGAGALMLIYWIAARLLGAAVSYALLLIVLTLTGVSLLNLSGMGALGAGLTVSALGLVWLLSVILPRPGGKADGDAPTS